MKKNIFLSLGILLLTASLSAQEIKEIATKTSGMGSKIDTNIKQRSWYYGGISMLSFSQDYTLNWAAGGDPAFSVKATGNYYLKYRKKRLIWDNTLDIDYGMQRNLETKVNTKTTDNVDLASNFGYQLKGNWNCAALVKLQTQISDGYTNEVVTSTFMTPAYLITSIGFEYKSKDWGVFFSPVTGKTTFKLDDRFFDGAYFAVDSGLKLKSALGGFARFTLNKNINPKISVNSKLELFSDYFNQPEKVDVNFEMRWIFKVTEWLSFSFYAALVYDYDIKFTCYQEDGVTPRLNAKGEVMTTDHLQLKENYGLTLMNKFSHEPGQVHKHKHIRARKLDNGPEIH